MKFYAFVATCELALGSFTTHAVFVDPCAGFSGAINKKMPIRTSYMQFPATVIFDSFSTVSNFSIRRAYDSVRINDIDTQRVLERDHKIQVGQFARRDGGEGNYFQLVMDVNEPEEGEQLLSSREEYPAFSLQTSISSDQRGLSNRSPNELRCDAGFFNDERFARCSGQTKKSVLADISVFVPASLDAGIQSTDCIQQVWGCGSKAGLGAPGGLEETSSREGAPAIAGVSSIAPLATMLAIVMGVHFFRRREINGTNV